MSSRPRLLVSSKALRAARLRALLTQDELAASAGLHPSTIGKLEAGSDRKGVSVEVVRKLTRALGCSADEISEVSEGVA